MGSANDVKSAEKTYNRFISVVKWTTPIVALIVLFVIILIS
jgi:hypothetical protein